MISIYAMKERRHRAEEERQYRAAERQREMNTKKADSHTRQERYAYAKKSGQTENLPIIEPRHTLTAASGKHQGTREYQEDALFVSETKSFSDKEAALMLGVVCDGMGGMADGALASNTAVNIVQREFQARETIEDIQQFIRATIVLANQQVHTQTKGRGGSTLVMAVIDHNKLYWGSVGDSRIYILRKGEIAQLTRDHNYSLTLMEQVGRQEISEQEARADPKKDALISFIGMDSLEIIDVSPSPFTLETGDVVLLCSDGLYKTLTDGEIAAIIFQHYGQVAETARILPLMTFDRGVSSQDNIAVILIQYDT
jgi:protein phosphatase